MLELTGTLWFSEKRIKILFLLAEGSRDIEHIKKSLNLSTREIMPQIKKLKKDFLVVGEKENLELSAIGELLVDNMRLFLDTIMVIDENRDFWDTRDLKGIPVHLLERIGELGHYYLIEPDLHNIYNYPKEFRENILKCKKVMMLKTYIHPAYPKLCTQIIENSDEYSLFMLPEAFKRMEKDFPDITDKLLSSAKSNVFLTEEKINIPILCVTEKFLYLSLFNKDGRYEHRDILSFDQSAVSWGKELIEYHGKRSMAIKLLADN
ncbi:MAG: winged helix-turn-helix domain-containing protein [Methanolobus sp.]|nr:winged helix-turn-helix domain-containing protein [Methanolobus sp.]